MTEWQKERFLRLVRLLETTAVLLFFYQALRALFSMLFGLIYDALFASQVPMAVVGGVMGVVILALLAPLAASRAASGQRLAMLAGAAVVFLARIALTLDHLTLRLATSILIVAATGFYLAVRLRADRGHTAYGLILALVVDQLLRAAGQTMDPTLQPAWGPTQVLISVALCLVSVGLAWRQRPAETGAGPELGPLAGPVWGGWLFLQTALLAFPNALARWSGESYLLFALSWPFVLVLTLLGRDLWQTRRGWIDGLLVQVILLCGLAAGYLLAGPMAFVGLLLAHLAAAVALFSTFPDQRGGSDGRGGPGPALALGNLLFFFLHLAYAFTFTYAYTLDLFRDLGLPIFVLAAFLVGLPLLRLPARVERASRPSITRWFTVWGAGVLVLAWILLVVAPAQPRHLAAAEGSFRAMTYNIHYGYDAEWHLRLEDQAAAIEASGADVVMLQEVDTGRPTSYMVDNALWLARRLEMTAVYLPTIEHLTGIALLSRYPIIDSRTLLLPSELEQTGIIWALVNTAGSEAEEVLVSAFGIWLGLEPEERARQLDAALPFLADPRGSAADPDGSAADPAGSAAVFGGDFNATPDSPIYARIAAEGFVDPFVALGLDPPLTDPAVNPSKRIDFVWLRDLEPLDARVPASTASDHRLVVVESALP
jgi:endonuclease/exonuclease/phosphatase family metal-dependent hydrolase